MPVKIGIANENPRANKTQAHKREPQTLDNFFLEHNYILTCRKCNLPEQFLCRRVHGWLSSRETPSPPPSRQRITSLLRVTCEMPMHDIIGDS